MAPVSQGLERRSEPKTRDQVRTEFLQNPFWGEMRSSTCLIGKLDGGRTTAQARIAELERNQGVPQDAGEGGRSERTQRLRVPDVQGWKIPILRDGEHLFHEWRTFDN